MSLGRSRLFVRRVVPGIACIAVVGALAPAAGASTPAYRPLRSQAAQAGAAKAADTTWPQTTGERLLDTPTTKPCVVTVVKNYAFKNTAYGPDKNFSGPYSPPKSCPGPWARVVATISVKVTGVQFDRVGDIRLANTDIFAYSTAEPRGDGSGDVTWTKSKDITDYTNLLEGHHKITFEIDNVVTGPYDGIYYGTLKLTYYPTDSSNPEPAGVPDRVLSVIREGNLSSDTTELDGSVTIPQNATSVETDLIIQGHGGCDEFWWADAPPPFPGQCGTPPYREAEVFIDGTLAGIVEPYPYLFTGADGPSWWEPVSAPQTMNLRPWRLDLTPFLGMLTDGQSHQISVKMLNWTAGDGDFFRVNLALLVDVSDQTGATTGALTSASAPKRARILQTVSSTRYQMDARHAFKAVGWYQVPGGPRVTSTVTEQIHAVSDQSTKTGIHNWYAFDQVSQLKTAKGGDARPTVDVSTDSHLAKIYNVSKGWNLDDSESRQSTHNGHVAFSSLMNDAMTSLSSSGYVSNESWRYADTAGMCGTTHVGGLNGTITVDHETGRCDWTPPPLMPALRR